MAGQTVKLTFQVSDDGTLKVLDDANAKLVNVGKSAEEGVSRADRAFTALKVSAAAAAAAIGTAVVASAAVVKQQIDQIDEIGLMARNLGLSAQELSGLSVAAELANVQLGELGRAVGTLSTKINDARQGGASKKIFDELGIDISSGKSATDVLFQVADAFAAMDDKVSRTAASRELFSRGGVAMVEVLSGGSAALREQIGEASRLGLVFSDVHAILADNVNDDLDRLQMAVQGTARELTILLLPIVQEVTTDLTNWTIANREIIATDLAGYFRDLVPYIEGVVSVLSSGNDVLNSFADSVASLRTGGNVNDIQQGVNRRLNARGLSAADLAGAVGDIPGNMSSNMSGFGGVDTGDFGNTTPERVDRAADAAAKLRDRLAEAANAARNVAGGVAGARVESNALAKSIEEDLNFALGRIEQGNVLGEYFAESVPVVEEASVQIADTYVAEMERAQAATINLGAVLSDSLTSAMDNLIASGKFDLAGLFTATSRTLASRVAGGFLEEAFSGVDFSLSLPSFGRSAGAARTATAGSITGGQYGAGMSFDASTAGVMTDAATGAAVVVPAGLPAGASGFSFASAAGGGLAGAGIGMGLGSALGLMSSSEEQVGAAVGSAAGIAAGAAIGTVLLPGIGTAMGAAIGGLVGALGGGGLGGLFESKPNKDQATRTALDDAFKDAGLFPSLALAQETPDFFKYVGFPGGPAALDAETRSRINSQGVKKTQAWFDSMLASGQIRESVSPAFMGGMSSEIEALGVMLGLEGSQVDEKVGRNLGRRADVLGLSEEQVQRELRQVAQSVTTLDEALKELNFSFLRNAVDGKDAAFSQEQYNERFRGMVELLAEDLPAGVDAVSIALQHMDQMAGYTVVNIQDAIEAIREAEAVASGLQGGLRGAAGGAITGFLTGNVNAQADFRTSVLNSALSATSENLLNGLVKSGPLGALMEGLTSSLLGGDAAGMEAALANLPAVFDQIVNAAGKFEDVFKSLAETMDTSARTYTITEARAGRQGALDTLNRVRFAGMAPGAQTAELQRRLGVGRSILDDYLSDGIIDAGERPGFESTIGRFTGNAEALFGQAQQFATGSPMNRELLRQSEDALGYAVEAWDAAIQVATVGDMSVSTMSVGSMRIDSRAATALFREGLRDPEARRIVRDVAAGAS